MAERAKFTYHENPRWRRPPYWILKNVNISGLDDFRYFHQIWYRCITAVWRWSQVLLIKLSKNCNMAFSLHVVDCLSDDYNFSSSSNFWYLPQCSHVLCISGPSTFNNKMCTFLSTLIVIFLQHVMACIVTYYTVKQPQHPVSQFAMHATSAISSTPRIYVEPFSFQLLIMLTYFPSSQAKFHCRVAYRFLTSSIHHPFNLREGPLAAKEDKGLNLLMPTTPETSHAAASALQNNKLSCQLLQL